MCFKGKQGTRLLVYKKNFHNIYILEQKVRLCTFD